MTDRANREGLAGASVLALSSLALAASWLVVLRQDGQVRAAEASVPVPAPTASVAPPMAGLRPVAPARRRVVVVRRSRAS